MISHIPHPFGIIGLAMGVMAVTATGQYIEDHELRLPTVCSVGAVVIGGAWQLSRRFQRIEDHFQTLDEKLNALWCIKHPDKNTSCPPEKHEHE